MNQPPLPGKRDAIQRFWLDYQKAGNVQVEGFSATAFGHTRAVADELAALIAEGHKRAHATLERDFEAEGDDLPRPGDHVVVLDGSGAPRAIVRTRHVERRYFNDIDDEFAFECGEGDRTLAWWLVAYRQEFAERAEAQGFQVGEKAVLILEYFDLVWPQ
ncbi:MAG TPA: ASCH domain-containing protein [Burkholderiaceae bacterium]|nr:ASCH domain-containing protein [Burkholderiaceae bacterium]